MPNSVMANPSGFGVKQDGDDDDDDGDSPLIRTMML